MCKDRDFESLPKRKWTISFEKRIEILKHKIVWKIKFAHFLVKDLKKSFSRFKNGFSKKNKKEVGKTFFCEKKLHLSKKMDSMICWEPRFFFIFRIERIWRKVQKPSYFEKRVSMVLLKTMIFIQFRLCLVHVKYFPENKYFPEMLFSGKENIFKCLVVLWKFF